MSVQEILEIQNTVEEKIKNFQHEANLQILELCRERNYPRYQMTDYSQDSRYGKWGLTFDILKDGKLSEPFSHGGRSELDVPNDIPTYCFLVTDKDHFPYFMTTEGSDWDFCAWFEVHPGCIWLKKWDEEALVVIDSSGRFKDGIKFQNSRW